MHSSRTAALISTVLFAALTGTACIPPSALPPPEPLGYAGGQSVGFATTGTVGALPSVYDDITYLDNNWAADVSGWASWAWSSRFEFSLMGSIGSMVPTAYASELVPKANVPFGNTLGHFGIHMRYWVLDRSRLRLALDLAPLGRTGLSVSFALRDSIWVWVAPAAGIQELLIEGVEHAAEEGELLEYTQLWLPVGASVAFADEGRLFVQLEGRTYLDPLDDWALSATAGVARQW